MQNLPKIVEDAKAAGITVKQFCTYCPASATGDLALDDGAHKFTVPICEGCMSILREKFPDKFA